MVSKSFLLACIYMFAVRFVLATKRQPILAKRKATFAFLSSALLLATNPSIFLGEDADSRSSPFEEAPPHRHRKRRHVHSIFEEMGPYYVRRAYRMKQEHFWRLHRLLLPHLPRGQLRPPKGSKKTWNNGAKNGLVPTPSRLSCALRYFAGGAVPDIAVAHGMSQTEVYDSVWMIMNAVNKCKDLAIHFPTDHNQQRQIAKEFQAKSKADFPMCVGAVDGILIWIEKPNADECEAAKCGPKKFFCGRKKKFGLNMQGTCDVHGRLLNIAIGHPGATSDFLAFSTTKFCHRLEKIGFLAPGLCLFGDNAYVNAHYMATPFKSVKDGSKFDYNYFHSNLRIKIECCFGMLVRRWGILRRPISASIGLKKTTALVSCLCRLHNYCINCRLEDMGTANQDEQPTTHQSSIAPALAIDDAEIASSGGIPMERTDMNEDSPEQLLHGGEHYDDVPPQYRQQYTRLHSDGMLPRDILHGIVCEKNLRRPVPGAWANRKPKKTVE